MLGRRGGSAATIRVRAGAGEEGRAGTTVSGEKKIDFGHKHLLIFNFDRSFLPPNFLSPDRWIQHKGYNGFNMGEKIF